MTRGGLHPAAARSLSRQVGGDVGAASIFFLSLAEGEGREGVVGIAVTLAAKTASRTKHSRPFSKKPPPFPPPAGRGRRVLGAALWVMCRLAGRSPAGG